MRSNENLKKKLAKGEIVIGTWCEIPSPEVINIVAKAGLDFVIIDMEHGAMDFHLAGNMVIAAEAEGCFPLIRVARNDESDILRALETSAEGIIVPHVETIEDRNKTVRYAKFSPIGDRSLNPYTRAGGYRSSKDFTTIQNENSFIGLIIEGKAGIQHIDDIINDEQVDLVYVGTYDISSMLGIPGDTKNPLVFDTLAKITNRAKAKKKAVGCLFHDGKELAMFRNIGIQFLCYKVDTSIIYDTIHTIIRETHV